MAGKVYNLQASMANLLKSPYKLPFKVPSFVRSTM